MNASRAAVLSAALAFCAAGPAAVAQPDTDPTENLDLTIRILPDSASDASEITRVISLPEAAAAGRVPREVPGDVAGRVDAEDAGPGRDVAAEARAGGREFGEQMRERARENREDRGRGDGVPAPGDLPVPDELPVPGDLPVPEDLPVPDDRPGPPESIGTPAP